MNKLISFLLGGSLVVIIGDGLVGAVIGLLMLTHGIPAGPPPTLLWVGVIVSLILGLTGMLLFVVTTFSRKKT